MHFTNIDNFCILIDLGWVYKLTISKRSNKQWLRFKEGVATPPLSARYVSRNGLTIGGLTTKKSSFDSFKVEIIKYVKKIIPPMMNIMNQSLSDGIMPKLLKIAKVTPSQRIRNQYSLKL